MKFDNSSLLLYAVTDRAWAGEQTLIEQVEDALRGGVTCLQLREKNLDAAEFLKEAREIKSLCEHFAVPFIINDNVEVALACQATGIHIGQEDLPVRHVRSRVGKEMIIGVSVQTVAQAKEAEAGGADYLGVGAVFPTLTKTDAEAVSFETLKQICEVTSLPVVAIGGITAQNLLQLSGSGIAGIALVSAIFAQKNIEAACRELKVLSELATRQSSLRKVLTIAGSDCSGGAGIQADLKTIAVHKMYGMSVITALTAQNTTGVTEIMDVSADFVGHQLDSIFTDIVPDAVKIGMVSRSEVIEKIAEKLIQYKARNIVVDPVMVSTSGHQLLSDEALDSLKRSLLPLGCIITPNLLEAQVLCGFEIHNEEDMKQAARILSEDYGNAVLIKGGHLNKEATDWLYDQGTYHRFTAQRVDNPNSHGTGCTLSSAIACNLARGKNLVESIELAKTYLTGALRAQLNLGKGRGPLDHTYLLP
jgi:hydroxymethylpyrimidine kinase/phosphomethylpyrimidine kinase/thiamine-phosphate diphosphorylase